MTDETIPQPGPARDRLATVDELRAALLAACDRIEALEAIRLEEQRAKVPFARGDTTGEGM